MVTLESWLVTNFRKQPSVDVSQNRCSLRFCNIHMKATV